VSPPMISVTGDARMPKVRTWVSILVEDEKVKPCYRAHCHDRADHECSPCSVAPFKK
jgi:hypothetical protein